MAADLAPERDTASAVLASARETRAAADREEARLLMLAVDWAAMHSTDSLEDAAAYFAFGDHEIPIGGEGTPLVTEFCIAEFAAAINLPTEHGKKYVGEAMELRHRLPRTWRRVVDGDLLAWRARRVAERTMQLSREAASYVDLHVARVAHTVGPAALTRAVDEAIARFMPAEARAAADLEQRRFDIDDRRVSSLDATVSVFGHLDLADAMDLEAVVSRIAGGLRAAGCDDSLDVRRSRALGILARGGQSSLVPGKQVVLHVHVTPGDPVAHVGALPVLVEQVTQWCAHG